MLGAETEVSKLRAQLGELNCQLWANQEEMAEAYNAVDRVRWEMEQLRTIGGNDGKGNSEG